MKRLSKIKSKDYKGSKMRKLFLLTAILSTASMANTIRVTTSLLEGAGKMMVKSPKVKPKRTNFTVDSKGVTTKMMKVKIGPNKGKIVRDQTDKVRVVGSEIDTGPFIAKRRPVKHKKRIKILKDLDKQLDSMNKESKAKLNK